MLELSCLSWLACVAFFRLLCCACRSFFRRSSSSLCLESCIFRFGARPIKGNPHLGGRSFLFCLFFRTDVFSNSPITFLFPVRVCCFVSRPQLAGAASAPPSIATDGSFISSVTMQRPRHSHCVLRCSSSPDVWVFSFACLEDMILLCCLYTRLVEKLDVALLSSVQAQSMSGKKWDAAKQTGRLTRSRVEFQNCSDRREKNKKGRDQENGEGSTKKWWLGRVPRSQSAILNATRKKKTDTMDPLKL